MPIYEFKCGRCGDVFETLVRSWSDDGPRQCPACGSTKCEKVFSVFASHGTSSGPSGSGASCGSCSSHNCSTCGR